MGFVLINGILIGVQIDYGGSETAWEAVDSIFLFVFTVEVTSSLLLCHYQTNCDSLHSPFANPTLANRQTDLASALSRQPCRVRFLHTFFCHCLWHALAMHCLALCCSLLKCSVASALITIGCAKVSFRLFGFSWLFFGDGWNVLDFAVVVSQPQRCVCCFMHSDRQPEDSRNS